MVAAAAALTLLVTLSNADNVPSTHLSNNFEAPPPPPTDVYNVLMIAIDDMRPEMEPYGDTHMHTPNLQRLANRSVVFERAYVQVALCMPSRTALLTSRRPDTTMNWLIQPDQWFRDCGGPACSPGDCGKTCGMKNGVTLPQHFKNEGFFTVGMGKIFHEGAATRGQDMNVCMTGPVYLSILRMRRSAMVYLHCSREH